MDYLFLKLSDLWIAWNSSLSSLSNSNIPASLPETDDQGVALREMIKCRICILIGLELYQRLFGRSKRLELTQVFA